MSTDVISHEETRDCSPGTVRHHPCPVRGGVKWPRNSALGAEASILWSATMRVPSLSRLVAGVGPSWEEAERVSIGAERRTSQILSRHGGESRLVPYRNLTGNPPYFTGHAIRDQ